MIDEDFDAYFGGDFATAGVLAGVDVEGILGTETVEEPDGLLTQAPTFRLATRAAAAGQALVANAVSYVVRRVEQLPPDGATMRLVLARS